MVSGGGELVVRYGPSMVGRIMVIAAVVASVAHKKIYQQQLYGNLHHITGRDNIGQSTLA